jgi:hypothetical protein
MHRWIWTLIAISLSTTVYFTIRYGLRPKPIPVMSPTSFERREQIGIVVYKRLRQNIRNERLVLLGGGPDVEGHAEVWSGLLQAAAADQEKIVVFTRDHDSLVAWSERVEIVPYAEAELENGSLVEQVRERLANGRLVILIASTSQVSHLVDHSLSQRLDRGMGHPVLSVSSLKFAVNNEAITEMEPECLEPIAGKDTLRRLSCAAARVSRRYSKKKLAPEKIWAVMERHGLKEYLIFIHQP